MTGAARRLDDVFDPRRNSLNAFRLLFAALVIVSHAWLLSGAGPQPALGGVDLGTWAVIGFFAISGFLITRSRLSGTSASAFYWNRGLRLLPGLFLCVLIVAFVFAPLSVAAGHGTTYSFPSAVTYVLTNAPLSPQFFSQKSIESTLIGVPVSGYWNGPLWTLFWEACCYAAVGLLASVVRGRWFRLAIVVVFTVSTVIVALVGLDLIRVAPATAAVGPLIVAFFAGALAYVYRDRFDVSWPMVVVWALVIVATTALGLSAAFAALPFFLLVMRASDLLPLSSIGSRRDISYGLYIYGWPVQQLILFLALPNGLPLWAFIGLSLAGAAPLAFLSCIAVEQPALRFKRSSRNRPPVPA